MTPERAAGKTTRQVTSNWVAPSAKAPLTQRLRDCAKRIVTQRSCHGQDHDADDDGCAGGVENLCAGENAGNQGSHEGECKVAVDNGWNSRQNFQNRFSTLLTGAEAYSAR